MTLLDHYYSLSAFAYILSGVFFAVVRWFHVCHPYKARDEYYHPDRRLFAVFFSLTVILYPYVLHPGNPDAWFLMKSFFPLCHLYITAVLILNYFGTVKHWHRWRTAAVMLAVPIFSLLGVLFVKSVLGGDPWSAMMLRVLWIAVVFLGVVAAVFCFYSIKKLMFWLQQQNESDYLSNPDDFPTVFARKLMAVPYCVMIVSWGVFFADSKGVMALLNILLVVFNVSLLLIALHTKRQKSPFSWLEEIECGVPVAQSNAEVNEKQTKDKCATISDEKVAMIVKEIKTYVEEKRQFLNPHLTVVDVADNCGYGRTYVSQVLSSEMGGFFNYVNSLRLQYARQYREEHPLATQDEVACASGFTSRQTYYAVRRRMNQK